MNTKQDVVQWLKDVSTGEVDLGDSGICYHLPKMLGVADRLKYSYTPQNSSIMGFLKARMERYAMANRASSGYPVPHPTLRPSAGYFHHKNSGNSMNDTTEYGLNRRALAAWLADELDGSSL